MYTPDHLIKLDRGDTHPQALRLGFDPDYEPPHHDTHDPDYPIKLAAAREWLGARLRVRGPLDQARPATNEFRPHVDGNPLKRFHDLCVHRYTNAAGERTSPAEPCAPESTIRRIENPENPAEYIDVRSWPVQ